MGNIYLNFSILHKKNLKYTTFSYPKIEFQVQWKPLLPWRGVVCLGRAKSSALLTFFLRLKDRCCWANFCSSLTFYFFGEISIFMLNIYYYQYFSPSIDTLHLYYIGSLFTKNPLCKVFVSVYMDLNVCEQNCVWHS